VFTEHIMSQIALDDVVSMVLRQDRTGRTKEEEAAFETCLTTLFSVPPKNLRLVAVENIARSPQLASAIAKSLVHTVYA
jgi:hypothetical protein